MRQIHFPPSRSIKSSDIRGILKLDSSVSRTIQKRRLKWLGHVLRHDPTTLPNSALEFVKGHDWKHPRGDMKWTWRDLVKADLKPLKMNKEVWDAEWFSIASDASSNRRQWNAIIRDVQEAGNGQWLLDTP